MPLTDREVLDGLIKAIEKHSKEVDRIAATGIIRISDRASKDRADRVVDSIKPSELSSIL